MKAFLYYYCESCRESFIHKPKWYSLLPEILWFEKTVAYHLAEHLRQEIENVLTK